MVDHDILLDRLNTLDVLYGSVLDTLRLSRLYACPTADISLLSSCDSAGHVLPMIIIQAFCTWLPIIPVAFITSFQSLSNSLNSWMFSVIAFPLLFLKLNLSGLVRSQEPQKLELTLLA